MAVIKCNLRLMLAKLEMDKQRTISIRSLADEWGISRSTVTALLNNKTKRVDLRTCAKILVYFHSQGYYYTMADLFELKDEVSTP